MKIALVAQPSDIVASTADASTSIAIIIYQFARRLAEKHEVIIYSKQGPGQPETEVDGDGIVYRRFSVKTSELLLKPMRLLERMSVVWGSDNPLFASGLYHYGYAVQVARDAKARGCDVVHISNYSQFVPIIRKYNPDARVVLHMYCEWLSQLDAQQITPRLSQADLVLGCSQFITGKIRQKYPSAAGKSETVYLGADVEQFHPETDEVPLPDADAPKKLLFVARVSPEKGVHVLLDAFKLVESQYPGVQLDIVGPAYSVPYEFVVALSDDEQVTELAEFYRSRNALKPGNFDYLPFLQSKLSPEIAPKVIFHGFVPHSHLKEMYHETDIFVFPSVWDEPFGMPLVEAMASEVPVVATRGGGITEIVDDGNTGLLVNRGDADALAEALLILLNDDIRRRGMGKAARVRAAEHFSWQSGAETLLDLLEMPAGVTTP